jgi:hypothetical protein
MKQIEIIFLLICSFVFHAHSMNIAITDAHKKDMLNFYVPENIYTQFEVSKDMYEDLYLTEPLTMRIPLQEIQEYVRKCSGLSVDIGDVHNALQYTPSFDLNNAKEISTRLNTMGSVAARLYFYEYGRLERQDILQEISNMALETGYINAACTHVTNHKHSDYYASLIHLINAADPEKLAVDINKFLARDTLILLYKAMYSSPPWHELEKKAAHTPRRLENEEISALLCNAIEQWHQAPETRLFSALHPYSMGRLFCKQINEEYTQNELYKKTHIKRKGNCEYQTAMVEEVANTPHKLISWHDAYLLPENKPFVYCRSRFPSSMFTHLPSLCLLQRITTSKNSIVYGCSGIDDFFICDTDKKALDRLCTIPSFYEGKRIKQEISFMRCNLNELPFTTKELRKLFPIKWDFRNYTAPSFIKFYAGCKIIMSLFTGLYASSIQCMRFLYGNPEYSKTDRLFGSVRTLGFIFEPLLIPETILGLNNPQSIIWIDKKKEDIRATE